MKFCVTLQNCSSLHSVTNIHLMYFLLTLTTIFPYLNLSLKIPYCRCLRITHPSTLTSLFLMTLFLYNITIGMRKIVDCLG